jgi:hypothetical protein
MAKFTSRVVVDANGVPMANAIGKIYNITDTTNSTPLVISDVGGSPFTSNELKSNDDGVTPEFQTPGNLIVVKWVSGSIQLMMLAWDQVPFGGDPGQVLQKLSSTDYDYDWADPVGIPTGGTTGQILQKASNTSFDTVWNTPSATGNSVKAFGAVGDGVADDTAAIQAALDAGGAVYFPMGEYKVSATLKVELDAMSLIGEGSGNRKGGSQPGTGVRIIAASGFVGASILRVQRAADDRPLTHVHISDLTVEGNNVAGALDGIVFRASQSTIHHVSIWQCTGNGLRVRGYVSPNWDTYDDMFHNMIIANCTLAGVYLDNNAADTHFSHCVFLGNQDNFALIGGSSVQVTGCHFYDASRYNIFFNGAGSRSKFVNCKIEGAAQHGVVIDSTNGGYSDIQFIGNGFSSVDQAVATNTWDLVIIQGPSATGITRTAFIGNTFNSKGGFTVKPRFGINLSTNAAQGTVIVGNSFGSASSWGSAPINNGSTSTVLPTIRGNANCPDYKLPIVITASSTLNTDHAQGFPVEVSSATGVTLTVPPNAQPGFQKGNVIEVTQTGAGQVTFAAGSGVTLRTPRSLTTRAQWSTVRLRETATNTWILEGDLT